jgi:hypothetical protein
MTNPKRPTPLRDAASKVVKGVGVAVSFVTALVGFGVITAVQGDAVSGLLGLIPGAVTQIGMVLAAFNVASRAEPQVTPVADPRDNDGNHLAATGAQPGVRRDL